jgi:hypothetical protein
MNAKKKQSKGKKAEFKGIAPNSLFRIIVFMFLLVCPSIRDGKREGI